MKQYAIYLRKSRADMDAEARGEGETLERHRTALRALAARRNLTIVREYAELITGDSIAARPQMQLLLDDVKRGLYAGVIVNDIDRLGRGDSIDQEIIKYTFAASRCLIITPARDIDPASPSDQDMLDFSMFFARFEYRKISQRLLQGRIRSVESGNYIQSRIPFGYIIVKDGKSIKLAPDPKTAPIVKMIYEMYASRTIGYSAIARKLNEMGIRTTFGHQFWPSSVHVILTNPVYIGKTEWGKSKTITMIEDGKKVKRPVASQNAIVVNDTHPPIIPEELFNKVQSIFEDNKRIPRANINKPISNPLAGLVYCSQCGKIMQKSNCSRGRSMLCLTYNCPTIGTPVYVVEREVIQLLREWSVRYADYQPDQNQTTEDDNTLILKRQLDTINTRLDKARELVELGIYSPAEYVEQKNKLTAQAESIKSEMKAKPATISETVHQILPQINKVIDAYDYAETAEQKNNLLKSIIQRIDYTKLTTTRAKGKSAENLTLVVYPKCI